MGTNFINGLGSVPLYFDFQLMGVGVLEGEIIHRDQVIQHRDTAIITPTTSH